MSNIARNSKTTIKAMFNGAVVAKRTVGSFREYSEALVSINANGRVTFQSCTANAGSLASRCAAANANAAKDGSSVLYVVLPIVDNTVTLTA